MNPQSRSVAAGSGSHKFGPIVLAEAPSELLEGRLHRLGEGIGKVVYASDHWVVKRERHSSEMMALIVIWRWMRRLERIWPGARKLLARPSRRIRFLRLMVQPLVLAVPRGVWLTSHAGAMWRVYASRSRRGERLARKHLGGTDLVPEQVTFPPVKVKVHGVRRWLVVSEATERVEATLFDRINELARARRFDEIGIWLDRFLDLRQAGWQRGVFSLDAHLKNFGVIGDRIVLLDAGGLTTNWREIERRLIHPDIIPPHIQLGLEATLRDRPDIAERFDARWRAVVNPESVRSLWPETVSL